VQSWLTFLWNNHPGYHDIDINQQSLRQLLDDGDVMDEMITHTIDAETEAGNNEGNADIDTLYGGDEEPLETAAIPDLAPEDTEMQEIRYQSGVERFHLSMPSVRQTPLSEFNQAQALLSLAFPTLFSRGGVDFVVPREKTDTYSEYQTSYEI
jgi:hypothetical protein